MLPTLPVFPNEEAWNNHNHNGGGGDDDDGAHHLPHTVQMLYTSQLSKSLHQAYEADSLILSIL